MISNQLNIINGIDPDADALKKLGNRIKTLRMKAGHNKFEKFAYQHGIGRVLFRRAELGGNVTYKNLLKIMRALAVTQQSSSLKDSIKKTKKVPSESDNLGLNLIAFGPDLYEVSDLLIHYYTN